MSNQPTSIFQRIGRGMLWTFISQYGEFVIGVLAISIMSRLVLPEEYNFLAIAVPWASYLNTFRLNFGPAVMSADDNPRFLSTHFWLEFCTALFAFPLAGLVYLLLPSKYSPSNTSWLMIIGILLVYLYEASSATIRYTTEKHLRYSFLGKLNLIQAILSFIVPIALALLGYGKTAIFFGLVLRNLVAATGLWLNSPFRPQWVFNRQDALTLLRSGWIQWTNGVLGKIIYEFDDFLVSLFSKQAPIRWLTPATVASSFYNKAYTAGKMPMDVAAGFVTNLALSSYFHETKHGLQRIQHAYQQFTFFLVWIIAFSSSIALLATEEIITILLGKNWMGAVLLIRLMSLFIVSRPFFQNAAQLLTAIGKEREMRFATFVQAITLIVLGPLLIWRYGAEGASVAVSVMAFLGWLVAEWYVTRFLQRPYWQTYLLPGIGMALALGLGFWLAPHLPSQLFVKLLLKSLLCVATLGSFLLIFQRKPALELFHALRSGIFNS